MGHTALLGGNHTHPEAGGTVKQRDSISVPGHNIS